VAIIFNRSRYFEALVRALVSKWAVEGVGERKGVEEQKGVQQ